MCQKQINEREIAASLDNAVGRIEERQRRRSGSEHAGHYHTSTTRQRVNPNSQIHSLQSWVAKVLRRDGFTRFDTGQTIAFPSQVSAGQVHDVLEASCLQHTDGNRRTGTAATMDNDRVVWRQLVQSIR